MGTAGGLNVFGNGVSLYMAHSDDNVNDFLRARRARTTRKSIFGPVSEVKPRSIETLWGPRLPVGASTLLTGRGGLGKSTVCAWIAAQLSAGSFGRRMSTVFLSAEDPVDSVLQERLIAAGADLNLIWCPQFGESRPNITAGLLDDIASLPLPAPLGRVIFDGFVDFILGVNTYDDHQIRPVFSRLEAWAQPRQIAVLGIVHPSKGDPAGIAGTRAFRDCSRSVLVVEARPTPDHPLRALLHHEKHNWTAQADMLAYEPGCGAVAWLPIVEDDAPAEDIPAAIRADLTGFTDAREFLMAALADGPQQYADLVAVAAECGIPARTLRHARVKLGVQSRQSGFGETREATWWLPSAPATQP